MSALTRIVLLAALLVGGGVVVLKIFSPESFELISKPVAQWAEANVHWNGMGPASSPSLTPPQATPSAAQPDADPPTPPYYGIFLWDGAELHDVNNPANIKQYLATNPRWTKLPDIVLYQPGAAFGMSMVHYVTVKYVDRLVTFEHPDLYHATTQDHPIKAWHAVLCQGEASAALDVHVGPVHGDQNFIRFHPPESVPPGVYGIVIGPLNNECDMEWVPYMNMMQGPPPASTGRLSEMISFAIGGAYGDFEKRDCVYLQIGGEGFMSAGMRSVPCNSNSTAD